jgi:hypothetical protein
VASAAAEPPITGNRAKLAWHGARFNASVSGHTERSSEYTQHCPAEAALYQLVAQHLETFLAEAREQHERGLPAYVVKEFRAFLKCGACRGVSPFYPFGYNGSCIGDCLNFPDFKYTQANCPANQRCIGCVDLPAGFPGCL